MKAFSLLTMLFLLFPGAADGEKKGIRVLILTGSNNHNWKETTPFLKDILEKEGMRVETTVPPERINGEALAGFDVILSNWTSWGKEKKEKEAWPDEAKKAYESFVSDGKGHVTLHAGGCSFYDEWPEYRNIVLLWWDLEETGHGPQHDFKVRIEEKDHPAVKGLGEFEIRDELWISPGVAEGAEVLASSWADADHPKGSGAWEPCAAAASYGEGRCFALLLGHGTGNMENAGFRSLFIRGIRWAAGE